MAGGRPPRRIGVRLPAHTRVSVQALWWPPTKIATRYHAPYLLGREAEQLSSRPPDAQPVVRELEFVGSPAKPDR